MNVSRYVNDISKESSYILQGYRKYENLSFLTSLKRRWLRGRVRCLRCGRSVDRIPHIWTLGKSFTRSCLYEVIWRPVVALLLNSTPVIACYHPFILYL